MLLPLQAAKPEWKSWASPCLCPRVFDCCVMHSKISLSNFSGGHWESVYEHSQIGEIARLQQTVKWNMLCVCVCVCVSFSLSLCICTRAGLYFIGHSHPACCEIAWPCHCVCQTRWQPFCKILLRDSFILFCPAYFIKPAVKVDAGTLGSRLVYLVYSTFNFILW